MISGTISIESAVRTNKGKMRENNEDNFYILDTFAEIDEANEGCAQRKYSGSNFQIYAVCDGMGGCERGELAAYTVVSDLSNFPVLGKESRTDTKNFHNAMLSFLSGAGKKCCEMSGGGCTVSMVCVTGKQAYIVNVGDSRIYLWSKNKLTQLTCDQTYAYKLYTEGKIDKDSIVNHPQNHVLVQYIGMPGEYDFEPYISKAFKPKKGDIYILCSDGLSDMVSDEGISEILSQSKNLDSADICRLLTAAALANGGGDNVTVMALKRVK